MRSCFFGLLRMSVRSLFLTAFTVLVCCLPQVEVAAQATWQSVAPQPAAWQPEGLAELRARLDAQAAEIQALRTRLDQQPVQYGPLPESAYPNCYCGPNMYRLPVVVDQPWCPPCEGGNPPTLHKLNFYVDYDKGFVIRPINPDLHPYELKIGGRIQFRHHAFVRNVDTFTDNAGTTFPVRNRNVFDIERARLKFTGYALDPRFKYFLQLDGDTDGRHGVDFFDYWWGWQFNEDLLVMMGKSKVPASRQWILSSANTRLVDRPMANDFFRPDRSVGLFAFGKLGERSEYGFMLGNGYNTANLPEVLTDDQLAVAGSHFFDPWGEFGSQIVDWDYVCDPRLRIGHSFVYAPTQDQTQGQPLGEGDFLRLTDGTQLTATGALAPAVTVTSFDVILYGVDAAVKYRGWSANAEVFFRWIKDIQGDGALPTDELFQRGFYVEGGRFLVPKKLDFNVRYSQVDGFYGHSSDYAAGINWWPLDTSKLKVSLDATVLDGSPLQNTSSNILLGDDGVLIRAQVDAAF